jgi:hypothetical protein
MRIETKIPKIEVFKPQVRKRSLALKIIRFSCLGLWISGKVSNPLGSSQLKKRIGSIIWANPFGPT